MAKRNNKINNNMEKVLEYLSNNPDGISQADFMELIGSTSRTTFYSYLKEIESHGITLTKVRANKTTLYKLEDSISSIEIGGISKEDYYRYLIMQVILSHPEGIGLENPNDRLSSAKTTSAQTKHHAEIEYLFDYFSFDDESYNSLKRFPSTLGKTRLRELLLTLEEEGNIRKVWVGRIGYIYYPNYSDSRFIYRCSEEQISMLYQKLCFLPPERKDIETLSVIKNKLALALGRIEDVSDTQNYIVYGHKYMSFDKFHNDLAMLSEQNYIDHRLKIIYREDGTLQQTILGVGLIVYSEEKDDIFLLGQMYVHNEAVGKYAHIPLSSIHNIKDTNIINTEYKDSYYIQVYNTMFSISSQRSFKVEAELDKVCKVDEKYAQLASIRSKTCKIINSDISDTFTYSDEASDTDTLKQYLLGFGRACTVLSPNFLRQEIKNDLESTLQAYVDAGFDYARYKESDYNYEQFKNR